METSWFFRLAYDSNYDSYYDSDYDSYYDSDFVASENQPLVRLLQCSVSQSRIV